MDNHDLVILYLMSSAPLVVPTVLITLTLKYGKPFPTVLHLFGHRAANRGPRNIGMARFQQFFDVFDGNLLNYIASFYQLACGVQFLTMVLMIFAIVYDLPLPFKPNQNNVLPPGTMYELLMFWITTTFLQLLPIVLLLLALYYGIPIPFVPKPPEVRVQCRNDITRWVRKSNPYATVRLFRFENLEKTLIYANCRKYRSGTFFKAVLYQRKEAVTRTQCFRYTDDDDTLQKVIPAPISVHQLDEFFSHNDD